MSREANAWGEIQIPTLSFEPFIFPVKGKETAFTLDGLLEFLNNKIETQLDNFSTPGTTILSFSCPDKCFLDDEDIPLLAKLQEFGWRGEIRIEWLESSNGDFEIFQFTDRGLLHSDSFIGILATLTPSPFDPEAISPSETVATSTINEIKMLVGNWQPDDADPQNALLEFRGILRGSIERLNIKEST
jgi:hypothetical protein